jgi:DNA-directed RNA polymerase specialized sigma24 family protein
MSVDLHHRAHEQVPISGRWTDTEDATLDRLVFVECKSHEEAARLLGRTTDAVSKRLSRRRLEHVEAVVMER